MKEHQKINLISSIESEDLLRIELIIPLARKMGFVAIDNQGPNEYGTDVILKERNKLGGTDYTSIVLKKGNIDNKSGSPTIILKVLQDQVLQAAKMPLEHPEIKKGIYPNNIWLVTNGKISNNAKSVFNKMLNEQFETLTNISYLDISNLVELTNMYWPEFYDDRRPFLSQYAEYLRHDLLNIKVSDIADTNKNIEDVLIPQMLIEQKNIDELSQKKLKIETRPIVPIGLLSIPNDLLILSGEAGSGKSTLLKSLAVEIAEKEETIPIVISARYLAETGCNLDEIYGNLCKIDNSTPYSDIKTELNKSNIILMVDGLDEIRDSKERKEILLKLKEIQESNKNILKTIISTRPEGNSDILTITKIIKTFQVLPVATAQVSKFFSKWFGGSNKSKANKLYRELTSRCILEKLPKTPLTLTLLAIVYESRNDLPSTLTELYKMFSDLLLGKWDSKKGIDNIKGSQKKTGILSYIAWDMHKNGNDSISQERMLYLGNKYLTEVLGDKKTNTKHLMQEVIDRSGLLVPKDNNIKFRHLSFQEYFCAQEIYCKKVFSENLSKWIQDSWWESVLFFSAGSLRNIDDYTDTLRNTKLHKNNKVSTIYNIGGMLQAAYETNVLNKRKLIRYAKEQVPAILEEIREGMRATITHKVPQFIPYAILIDLLADNYSSTYLNTPLELELGDLSLMDQDSSLQNLFIAVAMAKSNNIKGLQEISTSPEIKNPLILLLSDMYLDQYDEKFNSGKVSLVHKKVRKRVKKNLRAIQTVLELKKI